MDMEIITRVKERIGYKLTATNSDEIRAFKHAKTREAFAEMVKLNGVDSRELFDQIHQFFEKRSLKRPYHDWYHTCCVVYGTIQGLRYLLKEGPSSLAGICRLRRHAAQRTGGRMRFPVVRWAMPPA